jgi:hypothetical protein
MKNNKFYTVRTDPKFNQIIVEKDKFNAANAHIHDRPLDWLSTGTSKICTLKGSHLPSSGICKFKYERKDIFKSKVFA